jgi:molybdopterin/thiamine biosynthesis adenylyltransferase
MGIEAVSKQSKANILLFGLSSLGIEIAKNIVLSGCKRLSVQDV